MNKNFIDTNGCNLKAIIEKYFTTYKNQEDVFCHVYDVTNICNDVITQDYVITINLEEFIINNKLYLPKSISKNLNNCQVVIHLKLIEDDLCSISVYDLDYQIDNLRELNYDKINNIISTNKSFFNYNFMRTTEKNYQLSNVTFKIKNYPLNILDRILFGLSAGPLLGKRKILHLEIDFDSCVFTLLDT